MPLAKTPGTAFCYHCRAYHPVEEMRQIGTRSGKRWRCLRSIDATRATRDARDAFGRTVTELHRAETEERQRNFRHPLPYR